MHNPTREHSTADHNLRVAIIGAGVSGLTAAYYLKKRGFDNVVVFEKEERVGGKICSYPHEGQIYELGAVWLSRDYVVVTELMEELLAGSHHYAPCDVTDVLSMTLGRSRSYLRCVIEDHRIFTMGRELLRFAGIVSKFSQAETSGFAGMPAKYHSDIESFASQNGIENLARLVSSFVTGCGYGYYREVPIMYLMKLFPMLMKGMVKHILGSKHSLCRFPGGWQYLLEQLAAETEVRLGSEVEKIERSRERGTPLVTVTADGKTETFDRIIVSPALNLFQSVMDCSVEERALADLVQSYRYRVALVQAHGLPHATVGDHVVRDKIGHVVTIARFCPETDVYNIYQLADDEMTSEDLNRLMVEDLEQMGGTVDRVITERLWNYFPHVSSENLGGFYERLEDLQGRSGTYYIGSLMNFETVESNAAYAKKLVLERF